MRTLLRVTLGVLLVLSGASAWGASETLRSEQVAPRCDAYFMAFKDALDRLAGCAMSSPIGQMPFKCSLSTCPLEVVQNAERAFREWLACHGFEDETERGIEYIRKHFCQELQLKICQYAENPSICPPCNPDRLFDPHSRTCQCTGVTDPSRSTLNGANFSECACAENAERNPNTGLCECIEGTSRDRRFCQCLGLNRGPGCSSCADGAAINADGKCECMPGLTPRGSGDQLQCHCSDPMKLHIGGGICVCDPSTIWSKYGCRCPEGQKWIGDRCRSE